MGIGRKAADNRRALGHPWKRISMAVSIALVAGLLVSTESMAHTGSPSPVWEQLSPTKTVNGIPYYMKDPLVSYSAATGRIDWDCSLTPAGSTGNMMIGVTVQERDRAILADGSRGAWSGWTNAHALWSCSDEYGPDHNFTVRSPGYPGYEVEWGRNSGTVLFGRARSTAQFEPPAAPSNFEIADTGPTSVTLKWIDTATNETGFELERSDDGETGWTNIANPAQDDEEFMDESVLKKRDYWYRIRAVNGNGASTWVEASTQTIGIPDGQTDGCGDGTAAVDPGSCPGDPVDTATGSFYTSVTDLALPGAGIPFTFTRSYNSRDASDGPLGVGWTQSYAAHLSIAANGNVTFHSENGQELVLRLRPNGSFRPDPGGRVSLTAVSGGYELLRRDQVLYGFDSTGKLTSLVDRNDRGLAFTYASGRLATVTDDAGREVTLTYNAQDRLSEVALPDGRNVTYAYTGDLLTSVTDVRDNSTAYTYDASGRLAEIFDQNSNRVVKNVYGADGRVTEQTDARGNTSFFAWDEPTQTATITDARSNEWKDVYDDNVLIAQVDPLGNRTEYGYDSDLNLTSIEDPRGNVTTMEYEEDDNLTSITAPAPFYYEQTFTYNSLNDIETYTDGRQETTEYDYDAAGNLTHVIAPGNLDTEFVRDATNPNLVEAIIDPLTNSTSLEYDADGNLTAVITPEGRKTTMTYDSSGRLESMVDGRGNVAAADPNDYRWTFDYDAANHVTLVTDPLGNESRVSYDPAGNLDWVKDANLHLTDYEYNPANLLKKVIAPDPTITTEYTYDAVGNLASRTDANNHVTVYSYDDSNRLERVEIPTGEFFSYAYDAAGNLDLITDAIGNSTPAPGDGVTDFTFDELNRLETIDYPTGTPDVTFGYDANSNRTSMTDGLGTVNFVYDALNRLDTVTRGTEIFDYAYDDVSNVTSRTYPDGRVIVYSYDDDSLLETVTLGAATTTYAYDAAGNPDTTTFPLSNGHVEDRAYDFAGRLTEIKTTNGTAVLEDLDYILDAVGNPESVTSSAGTTTYDYDSLDRLTEACFQASCPGPLDPFIRYGYDPVGNILTETRPTGVTRYTHDASDRLLTKTSAGAATTYDHDANGNLTDAGTTSYSYDSAGRMTSVATGPDRTTYSYSGDSMRERATRTAAGVVVGDTEFDWDQNFSLPEMVAESDATTGVAEQTYLYGLGLVATGSGASTGYYHKDSLGSVLHVTDATGATDWNYSYEPFGTSQSTFKADPLAPDNPMRFTGQYLDPTGLYHLRARQYEPMLGRFLSPDPILTSRRNSVSSAYGFGMGRPTFLIDPSGMTVIPGSQGWDLAEHGNGVINDLGVDLANREEQAGAVLWPCAPGVTCVEHSGLNPVPPGMEAITLGNTIFFRNGSSKCLRLHELVHVAQYRAYGDNFYDDYVAQLMEDGLFGASEAYPRITWEQMAYEAQAACEQMSLGVNKK